MLEPKDIARVRKQLGLTQAQLAKLSGVSQSLIAKIESGKLDPSFSKLKALSDTLERLRRKNQRKAKDIMTTSIIKVDVDTPIREAVRLMTANAISQLPVFEGDRPVGSICDRTVVKALADAPSPKLILKKRSEEIMEPPFPTVDEETPVDLLYDLLNFYQAVLVTRRDSIVGIITKADLLKFD